MRTIYHLLSYSFAPLKRRCIQQKNGWLFVLVLLGLFMFSACRQSNRIHLQNGLVIQNCTLISPEREAVLEKATLVMQGDSIVYVGDAPVQLEGTYQTIEASGKYVIPGLIDGHVHVTNVPGMGPSQEKENPALIQAYWQQLPKSYLYFGFTTLIDLMGYPDRIEAFQDQPSHPDLYFALPAVVANGYPMQYLPEELRFKVFNTFLYTPEQAAHIPPEYAPEAHSPKAVVDRIANAGAIAVKTTYEPGFDSPIRLPVPSDSLLMALQEEAHRHGLPLVAHGNSLEAHQALTKAKVDVIVHGLWNWDPYAGADTLPASVQQVLDQEIRANIGYIPTLQVIEGLKALLNPTFLEDPQLRHVLPADLIAWYQTYAGQWFARSQIRDGDPARLEQIYSRIAYQGQQTARYVATNQGRLLFGSDTPSSPTYANPPGYNGYLEIKQMHKAGIPLPKILAVATLETAKAYGLASRYGSIEIGKVANVLMLEKNPLTDVSAYDTIHTVVLHGKPMQRASLSATKARP